MMAKKETVTVKLVKSLNGRLESHKNCARGLGLRKINQVKTVLSTPENMGMIRKISYLLNVQD
jgi:large subunit ribosomal protein L30